MGTAFYIVLEHEIAGIDASAVDGKRLANVEKSLAKVAAKAGVRPLTDFFSADPESLEDLLDGEQGDVPLPEEQWFAAEEGLTTVQALLKAADGDEGLQKAKTDLLDLEKVLRRAQEDGVRWHLAVDF